MSSILNALKKVEKNQADQQWHAQGIGVAGPGNSSVRDLKRSRTHKNFALILAGVLLTGGIGWAAFVKQPDFLADVPVLSRLYGKKPNISAVQKTKSGGIASPPAARQTPAAVSPPVVGKPQSAPQSATIQKPKNPPVLPPKSVDPAGRMQPQPPSVPRSSMGNTAAADKTPAPQKNSAVSRQRIVAAVPKAPPATVPKPVQAPPTAVETTTLPKNEVPSQQPGRQLPVLREDSLELHAIAWSRDPVQRMAVVNEQIVREGGSFSGYTVVRIDADEIIVRKGQDEWRMPSR